CDIRRDAMTNHVAKALTRVLAQFKDKPNYRAVLTALVEPAQSVEDALQQLLLDRAVNTAIGVQLDALGKIVKQPRAGLGDEDYRRYVRARIATNRSKGTIADLLTIASLIVFDDAARY